MKNHVLKELPEESAKEILKGINKIGKTEITVSVMSKRAKPKEAFLFYFIVNMDTLIQDPVITKQDIAVLMKYAAKMQYGNQINISQSDIAEELGIDKSNVNKSVKKLIDHGVFTKEKRSMYLNWKYLAKGNLSEFIENEKEKQKALKQINLIDLKNEV